jgi:hsp70-interacting protein
MRMVNARVASYQVLYNLINPSQTTTDLEKLGMLEPLQDLLASSSEDIKVQALWVIGTAVQNNPAAQKAVRSHHPS